MNRWRSYLLVAGLAVGSVVGYFQLDNGLPLPGDQRARVGRGRRGRAPGLPSGSGSGASFNLAATYSFGASYAIPTAEAGAILCKVNAGGTAWECKDSAGVDNGVVTQGSGTTYVDTFSGYKAVNDITGSTAPVWDMGTPATLFAADFTIIAAGFPNGTAADTLLWLDASTIDIRNSGGSMSGRFGSSGTRPVTASTAIAAWAVVTIRKTGDVHGIRINGTNGTPQTYTDDLPGSLGPLMHFGEADNNGAPMRGPLAWVYLVPRSLSDAEVKLIEMAWWGAPSNLTYASSGDCVDNIATSGQIDCFSGNAPGLNATQGLRQRRAINNRWAADPLALATATDVGVPVVNSNVASGPLSRRGNAAEVDRLVDASALGFEGKSSVYSVGAAAGPATFTCYLAAGDIGVTTTKARLRIVTDGTGTTACDFSDLSATYAAKTCSASITGSPSTITAELLVGNAITDIGSILVSGCQLNGQNWAEPFHAVGNEAAGAPLAWLDVSGVSITSGGKYEVVFRAPYDPNGAAYLSASDIIYLWDATPTAGGHYAYFLFGYTVAGQLQSVTSNGLSDCTMALSGVGLTANQLYAMSVEWTGSGASCTCTARLNTCAGSVASCTATTSVVTASGQCPSQPDRLYLGRRYSGDFFTSASYNAVRIYTR